MEHPSDLPARIESGGPAFIEFRADPSAVGEGRSADGVRFEDRPRFARLEAVRGLFMTGKLGHPKVTMA